MRKSGSAGNRTGTSGCVARKSDDWSIGARISARFSSVSAMCSCNRADPQSRELYRLSVSFIVADEL